MNSKTLTKVGLVAGILGLFYWMTKSGTADEPSTTATATTTPPGNPAAPVNGLAGHKRKMKSKRSKRKK